MKAFNHTLRITVDDKLASYSRSKQAVIESKEGETHIDHSMGDTLCAKKERNLHFIDLWMYFLFKRKLLLAT